jgi:release factor glutamine methyltransferase
VRDAAAELEAAGVEPAAVDAEWLVGAVTGLNRTELVTSDRTLSTEELDRLHALVARRRRREPLAYVLGEWGFRRLTLAVDPRVLVPRPETEVVVERCLALLSGIAEPAVLDVGTGSGAIALSIADEHPGARVTAIDASKGALAVAAENASRTGLDVRLLHHDLGDGLPGGPYDLVVSNPPYVHETEVAELAPEVRDWEPREAVLDRGQTASVVLAAGRALKPGGWLVLETHCHGASEVAELVAAHFEEPRVSRDLAGRERVVEARWPG